MSGILKNWFDSGMDPDKFPPVPDSEIKRKKFLIEFFNLLAKLPVENIENSMGLVSGNYMVDVDGSEIAAAVDIVLQEPIHRKTILLIHEIVIDALIRDANWAGAIERLQSPISLASESGDIEELSILYNYRGVCCYRLARYPEAQADLEQSLNYADEINSDRRRARARINLGLVFKETGRLEDAAAHYKKALKLARENSDDRTVLSCYLNIGNIFKELHRWDDGSNALKKGIELAKTLDDITEEIRGRLNLGVLYLDEGKSLDIAKGLFEEVIKETDDAILGNIARSNLALVLIRLDNPAESLEISDQCLEDALRNEDHEGIWRARANLARAYAGLGKIDSASENYEQAIRDFDVLRSTLISDRGRAEVQRNLKNLHGEYIGFCLDKIDAEAAFNVLARSKQRALRELVDRKYPGSPESGDSLCESIKKKLEKNPETIIVDYFVRENSVSIFTCDHSGVSVSEISATLDEISDLIDEFYSEIGLYTASRQYRDAEFQKDVNTPDSLIKLGKMLLDPVKDRIADKKQLLIVPQGILHRIPFAALSGIDGKYLIESHSVAKLPSSDFYLFERNSQPDCRDEITAIHGKAEDLPGTRFEIDALRKIFSDGLNISDYGILKSDSLSGYLHFTGHAEFDILDPYSSALLLSGGKKLTVSDLIGGNFDLRKINLVTLSACETGVGKVLEGDEVVGISRAFLASGAGAVIMSMWKVSDDVTSRLMPSIYKNLAEGYSPSESLSMSIQFVLKERRIHPYFFAPFELTRIG